MKERHLKVRLTHRDYYHKGLGHKGHPKTSQIILKGSWLEEAGFVIDTPLVVKVSKNQLLITPKS